MAATNGVPKTVGPDVGFVSISPLLKRLSTRESAATVTSAEIAAAVALIFTNNLSPVQFSLLLWALHTMGLDHHAEVLAACAASMRLAAAQVDVHALTAAVKKANRAQGDYHGGLVRLIPHIYRKKPQMKKPQMN